MVKQKMYLPPYLDSQKLIRFSNKSSIWKEKRKRHGWRKETKKCKLLWILSKTSSQSSLQISGRSTRTCLMSQSEIVKLKRKGCTKSSRIFTKISRLSKIRKPSTTRVSSGQEEEETLPREQEVTSSLDLNRHNYLMHFKNMK